jgi:hypothetical protein
MDNKSYGLLHERIHVDQHNLIDSGYESILLHKHRIDAKSQQHPMTNWCLCVCAHTHTHILVIKQAMESIGKIIIGLTKGHVTLWPCHFNAIYIKKYLHAKEELWKLKYFTMQKYNLRKVL